MNEIKFCRACLITDVKMYSVGKSSTVKFYLKVKNVANTPLLFCYECVALLRKCEQFRDRCMRATEALHTVISPRSKITKDTIRALNDIVLIGHCLSLSHTETHEIPFKDTANTVFEHVKVENETKVIHSKNSNNVDSDIISSHEIKHVFSTQNEVFEPDACDVSFDNVIGVKDELSSDNVENQNASMADTFKTESSNIEDSITNNSESEYKNNIKKATRDESVRKMKKRFMMENPNEQYQTKKTRIREIPIVDNSKINIRLKIKKKKKLKKTGKVKRKIPLVLIENCFQDYISVDFLSCEEAQKRVSLRKSTSDEQHPFICEKCYEGFKDEISYEEHMKKHSPEYGKFVCVYCDLHFEQQSALQSHEDDEHIHKYSCKTCSYICYSRREVNIHVQEHINNKILSQNSEIELNTVNCPEKNTNELKEKVQSKKVELTKSTGPLFDATYFEGYTNILLMTPEEAKNEVLSRRETSNYMCNEFKCDLCFRGFESKGTYENHMRKHSPDRGNYECEFCHLRFPNQRYLSKHKLGAHKRKFSCKICSFVCFCSDQAKIHVKLHKGTKYPCEECGEIFSMPNSLLMHKRNKHSTTAVCDFCGNTFSTERGLKAHKLLAHRTETNPQLGPLCELCDVHFANEAAWKRHLVMSARHSVSNGCQHCGETFESATALKTHLRVHARKQSGQRRSLDKLPTSCKMCGELFRDGAEWRDHLLTVHSDSKAAQSMQANEKPQCVCEVCGKTFKKPCFLNYHMRVHTGEKPYSCSDCGKSYAYSGALAEHRATHAAGPQHRCHLCPKIFKFKSALYKHVRAHLGIRPHKCHSCDKSFPSPCELRSHTHHTHHKVPWPRRDRRRNNSKPTHQTAQETVYEYDN